MSEPLLVAQGIERVYDMGRAQVNVLRGCDLSVRAGEFTAIMGKSGSGKSTLLHILGALDTPQAGQVFFDGKPVFSTGRSGNASPRGGRRAKLARLFGLALADVRERRQIYLRRVQFGFVFQFYHLLPELNVLENVVLARMVGASTFRWWAERRAARADALAVLKRVGLDERLKHHPNELSGGERQRVAIARALVHRPRILFADEPTGNLDAEAGAELMSLLKGLHAEGQTMVMVTHDPGIAGHADRILRLEYGKLRQV